MRGYDKGRFSFNVKGGRCEACQGDGLKKISMHFLPDVYVPCEQCEGKRYNEETLQVTYKDKNIYDILEMTVEEALDFFDNLPKIRNKIQTLYDVGLGYIKLGQSATTLSGGEAQRVKLASELQKKSTGKTVYILDEPTTGLHSHDVSRLIDVLQRIVDQRDTIIVIEHNLDVIKVADHIIDLGPEGGAGGGTIVVTGTPEKVAKCEKVIQVSSWNQCFKEKKMKSITVEKLLGIIKLSTSYRKWRIFKRVILTGEINRPGFELAGFFKHSDFRRIIVFGDKEMAFIAEMTEERQKKSFRV